MRLVEQEDQLSDFMNRKRRNFNKKNKKSGQTQTFRVKVPKEGEVICVVIALMGGNRLLVDCKDGKERMCRIPGRLRKRIWVREGDVAIVKPWDIEGDKKGDLVWRYNKLDVSWLKRKGYL